VSRYYLVTVGFLVVSLAMAATGVIGLWARQKVAVPPPRYQIVTASFRLVAGLLLAAIATLHLFR
jgi:hypothetical protein